MLIVANLKFLLLGQFPDGPLGGLALTVLLFAMVGLGSLCVGVLLATTTLSPSRTPRLLAEAATTVIRSLPSLVFLFWLYFLLPALLHLPMTPLQSAVIALSIYDGAFIAEDIRGGFRAVLHGQAEAGRATGLTPFQVMRSITLPQALRAIIPALVNRYINLFLYTSTASVVGVLEFTRAATLVSNRLLIHPIEIFGFAAAVYLAFCCGISWVGRRLERRWDWAPKFVHSSAV